MSNQELAALQPKSSYKSLTLLAWLAVFLASGLFFLRGPLRADSGYINDFAAPYTATRLWLQHRNPYDSTAFFPTWHAAGAPQGKVAGNLSGTHPVYPPPTLVVLIPFALLPWPIAVKALTLLSAALYIAVLPLLASLLPGTWRDPIKPAFLAFGLALAPTQSGLHVTNVACLAATLLFFAIYHLLKISAAKTNLPAIAFLTLSICLKPTLGLILIPYLFWTRAWRTLSATLAFSAAITVASLCPLLHLGSVWLSSLRENIAVVFTNGGAADVSEQSLSRFDRIDMQLPLYALLHSRTGASILAALIAATLLLFWFKPTPTTPNHSPSCAALDQHILQIATLLAIGLIPFYQRFYSAMIVLLPVLWAFRALSYPTHRARSRWVLTLSSVFLINTAAIFARSPLLPSLTTRSHLLTNLALGPHLCWLLLLLAILQLTTQTIQTTQKSQLHSTVSS
ncbi:MAG TPA: glycosyltransferase family 87 protein [Edaphobacter sp.]|nr:glycosyltransferase family 87 protein [Edaphobacter sp.]